MLLTRRRRRVALLGVLLLAGCGDRTVPLSEQITPPVSYNVTVNATATSQSGGTLLHSAQVTLTIQN